ncbi:unnamed protein product [Mesocestoides corti]|uniref:Nuclear protein 1 n=1 Tax=Mesocestoides corti TaxID=53468 RepID=A0A0R3UBL2_MESCO|nr:unnamed protein product [Mesocestoides corti]
MDNEAVPADEYEQYDYEQDKITGSKGGRNRAKNELKHGFSSNRSDRIHLDSQINNSEKQKEAAKKKMGVKE